MKRKILREDMMANAERQVAGIGPGSKDEPFQQMAVSTDTGRPQVNLNDVKFPSEMENWKPMIFDIFEKNLILRNKFNSALQNPSIRKSPAKQEGLNKCIEKLDEINREILDIPEFLVGFTLDLSHK